MRTSKFHTFTAGVAVGAAVTALTVFCAGQAHADPDTQYIVDLANAGIPMGTPAQETYLGQLICQNVAAGLTPLQAAGRMVTGGGISVHVAAVITALAITDLCPQYAPQGSTQSAAPAPVTITSSIA